INYTFSCYTVLNGDGNNSNNVMPGTSVTVTNAPQAAVLPAGPISICNGSTVILTASSGNSYLWSNGATTQSITVSTTGNYSVAVSTSGGCQSTSAAVSVNVITAQSNTILFLETMGTGTASTIATYENNNSFDNDAFTMSGSGDVGITTQDTTTGSEITSPSGLSTILFTNISA